MLRGIRQVLACVEQSLAQDKIDELVLLRKIRAKGQRRIANDLIVCSGFNLLQEEQGDLLVVITNFEQALWYIRA
jgi:hypothetical protein